MAGEAEALERFDAAIRQGPPAGRVEGVEKEAVDDGGWDGFRVVHP